jgi:hypothetical protein
VEAIDRELSPVERWPFDALTSRTAERRLRKAAADLSEVRAELRADAIRAQHRAQALEQTARIREYGELSRVPPDELLELAPSLARELYQERGAE